MKLRIAIFLSIAGVLSGCATVTIRSTPSSEIHGTATGYYLARCTGERWIGLLPASDMRCPTEDGAWEVSPLFRFGQGTSDLEKLGRAAGLDRYCLYTVKNENKNEEDRQRGPQVRGLERLDRDCRGVQPSSSWVNTSGDELAEYTRAAIGGPPAAPARAKVRLTFLDTLPDKWASTPGLAPIGLCSRHGDSLGRLAQLSCGSAAKCSVTVNQRLALPEKGDRVCQGGTHGFITQLAEALWKELYDWETSNSPEDRLVLNLSLGWDGEVFGGFEQECDMPTHVRAVWDALGVTRKKGVLVLAAAGNRTAAPGTGPLLPAGWEPRGHHPRVFAVSGLGADGRPLFNSRSGALARRGAFGGPAVVAVGGGEFTPALTGSSVATAVVSSLAATTWACHPGDSPRKLVRRLEAVGLRLPWRADAALAKHRPRAFHIGPGIALQPPPVTVPPYSQQLALSVFSQGSFPPLHPAFEQGESQPQPSTTPCPNCTVDPPSESAKTASTVSPLTLSVELADDWDWAKYQVTLNALELRYSDRPNFKVDITGAGPWPNGTVNSTQPVAFQLQLAPGTEPVLATSFNAVLLHWTVDECTIQGIFGCASWGPPYSTVSAAIVTQ